MKQKAKDRLFNAMLILLFLVLLSGCAWMIIRTMTKWSIEGLG